MKKILRQLESYWFSPMPAQRLALLRIASGGFVLWYFITRYKLLSGIGRSDTDNFAPVGLAAWLSAPIRPTCSRNCLADTCLGYCLPVGVEIPVYRHWLCFGKLVRI
ncbi:MAG: hypothetical protein IPM98_15545 [Lewinellaceae bacterium]|nr:hypothetical protein [Lewinellaceae bacterium]